MNAINPTKSKTATTTSRFMNCMLVVPGPRRHLLNVIVCELTPSCR